MGNQGAISIDVPVELFPNDAYLAHINTTQQSKATPIADKARHHPNRRTSPPWRAGLGVATTQKCLDTLKRRRCAFG